MRVTSLRLHLIQLYLIEKLILVMPTLWSFIEISKSHTLSWKYPYRFFFPRLGCFFLSPQQARLLDFFFEHPFRMSGRFRCMMLLSRIAYLVELYSYLVFELIYFCHCVVQLGFSHVIFYWTISWFRLNSNLINTEHQNINQPLWIYIINPHCVRFSNQI